MDTPANESISSTIDARSLSVNQAELERALPEVFDGLDPAQKQLTLSKLQSVITAAVVKVEENYHAGPLPSPRALRDYGKVLSSAPERIISQFEKQSDHRMEMESTVLKAQINQSKLGQLLGYSIALLFLIASVALVLSGHEVAGTIIGSIDIVALVSVFVIGKIEQLNELRGK